MISAVVAQAYHYTLNSAVPCSKWNRLKRQAREEPEGVGTVLQQVVISHSDKISQAVFLGASCHES